MELVDQEWAHRIEREFQQCPGLQLTVRQAGRLWGLEMDRVARILDDLVVREVVTRTPAGLYSRCGDCAHRGS